MQTNASTYRVTMSYDACARRDKSRRKKYMSKRKCRGNFRNNVK